MLERTENADASKAQFCFTTVWYLAVSKGNQLRGDLSVCFFYSAMIFLIRTRFQIILGFFETHKVFVGVSTQASCYGTGMARTVILPSCHAAELSAAELSIASAALRAVMLLYCHAPELLITSAAPRIVMQPNCQNILLSQLSLLVHH